MAITVKVKEEGAEKTSKQLNKVTKSAKKLDQVTKKVSGAKKLLMAGGTLLAASGLNSVLKKTITLYKEQEQAEAKLAAVVRATGGAAGFTAEQLYEQAAALQQVTTVGDETIINTQAIIATFDKIKGDQFEEATKTALDLSAVLGQDLKSAAVQLGKVLQDPVKNLSALNRSGVSFTAQTEQEIKLLFKTGEVEKAQKIILDAIDAQVGGAAEALALTDSGKIQQLQNAWGDLGEVVGKTFASGLGSVAPTITQIVRSFTSEFEKAQGVADIMMGKYGKTTADLENSLKIANEETERLEETLRQLPANLRENNTNLDISLKKIKDAKIEITKQLEITRKQDAAEKARAEAARKQAETEKERQALLLASQTIYATTAIGAVRTEREKLELQKQQQETIINSTWAKEQEKQTAKENLMHITAQLAALEEIEIKERAIKNESAIIVSQAQELNRAEKERFGMMTQIPALLSRQEMMMQKLKTTAAEIGGTLTMVNTGIQSGAGAWGAISQAMDLNSQKTINNLQEEIEKLEENKEAKIANYIESGLSEVEAEEKFAAEKGEIEKRKEKIENEMRRRQFESSKAVKIIDSLMNTSLGITAALATANIPLAVAIGSMGALQTTAIMAHNYPGLFEGGIVPPQGASGGLYRLGDRNTAEVVTPLRLFPELMRKTFPDFMGRGKGATINYNINIEGVIGSPEEVARTIQEATSQANRVGGLL